MSDLNTAVWHREGNLLYTLQHAGWRKGEEQFMNRLTVRAEVYKGDQAEADALTDRLHQFLSAASPPADSSADEAVAHQCRICGTWNEHPSAGAPSREANPLAFTLEKVEGFLYGIENTDAPPRLREAAAHMQQEVRAALGAHYGHDRALYATPPEPEDLKGRAVPQSPISGEDYYPSHEALHDLVSLISEHDALNGGGPGWGERWKKAVIHAEELVRVEP